MVMSCGIDSMYINEIFEDERPKRRRDFVIQTVIRCFYKIKEVVKVIS